jgi:hypothetical protein
VPAETPVVDYRACCSAATWAGIANVRPGWPRHHGTALIARGTAPLSWTVAGLDGKPALSFTLPEPVDRAISGAPPADRQAAPDTESETVDWVFFPPHGPGPGWTFTGRRPCRHGDEHPWCKKGHPPVAGVPEPGAWALMLTGMAVLGGALRSRRRRAAAAISTR